MQTQVCRKARLHGKAAEGEFADVELGVTERPEEDLLGHQQREGRVDPVDLHGPVDQRAGTIVIADRDRQVKLGQVGSPSGSLVRPMFSAKGVGGGSHDLAGGPRHLLVGLVPFHTV